MERLIIFTIRPSYLERLVLADKNGLINKRAQFLTTLFLVMSGLRTRLEPRAWKPFRMKKFVL